MNRPCLDDLDLLFGEAVEVVDEPVDLAVGGVDLALEGGLVVGRLGGVDNRLWMCSIRSTSCSIRSWRGLVFPVMEPDSANGRDLQNEVGSAVELIGLGDGTSGL